MVAYKEDLAYIHDVGFGHLAREAAPALLELLRRRGITQGRVVDLGCGSGIWARILVDAGYDVLGVDISEAMIALARQRVPEADLRQASFLEVTLPPCEAVTSLGECLNYLFDEHNNLRALGQLFRRIYDALRPGGVFVFDIAEPGFEQAGFQPKVYREEGDWVVLRAFEEDEKRGLLTRRITTFRRVENALYRRDDEVHRLQLYKAADLAVVLRKIGFRVRLVRGYGSLRFDAAHAGLIARKP